MVAIEVKIKVAVEVVQVKSDLRCMLRTAHCSRFLPLIPFLSTDQFLSDFCLSLEMGHRTAVILHGYVKLLK